MFDAAVKALSQMFSPPFRAVLWKSIGAAIVILIVMGIALQRLLAWMVGAGGAWFEASVGVTYHGATDLVQLALSIMAGLGVVVGMAFLMPAVTALVASLFADEIADTVERTYYPGDPPGRPLPIGRALLEGLKTAGLSILVYLCALPFLLVAGLGIFIFFFATAFLLGREYFELAAMRFHPVAEAKALRKRHQSTVFMAGMLIAGFVSIPIVNLATPLFATALMVHMHKRLTESRRDLLQPAR
jgi:CysZ protein